MGLRRRTPAVVFASRISARHPALTLLERAVLERSSRNDVTTGAVAAYSRPVAVRVERLSEPGEASDSPVLVLSFRGVDFSSPEEVRAAARRLVAAHRGGHGVVAVLSASDDTSAALTALAAQISAQPPPREYDMLLSAGARIAVALCAMAIHDLGVEAISLSGSQAGIVTDENHGAASIVHVGARRVREALAQGRIVLVADAQGVSREHEITTFAKGARSATADALAAALGGSRQIVLDGSAAGVPAGPL